MADAPDTVVALDLGIWPEAAVSGAMLFQDENSAYLTFNAMRSIANPDGQSSGQSAGTALFTFKRSILTRFGYPNDEARWGIPAFKGVGYGIYEVQNSSWIKAVVQMNRFRFPTTPDDYVTRHYLFAFHDATFECLADGLEFQVLTEPFADIARTVMGRLHRG